jgi:hypothetical protein
MAGKRVTKVEVERRIAVVYDFLVMGGDTPRLVANISRLFGTSARETARYVAKALERLRSAQQEKLGNKFGEIAEAFREVRRRAFEEGNLNVALRAADREAAMWGLYAPTSVSVTWREEVVMLLRQNLITAEEVQKELGDDIAKELLITAGVSRHEPRRLVDTLASANPASGGDETAGVARRSIADVFGRGAGSGNQRGSGDWEESGVS